MKRGIITGSSRGIGRAAIELFSQNPDYETIGSSTSGSQQLLNSKHRCLELDLSDTASISRFVDEVGNVELDFLVNNAGILIEKWDTSNVNIQQLKHTFEVNFFGTVELTEKLLPLLKSNSHIINITSDWGSFSELNFDMFQPHYKMSKAALNMYTKLLAKRLKHKNVTVSSLDPGWTRTDMGGEIAPRLSKDVAMDIFILLSSNVESGLFWHKGKTRAW